jgi:hypothetical protein
MVRTMVRYLLVVLASAAMAAPAAAQITATLVAGGLSAPVAFVQDPSDPTVQVIVEKTGLVKWRKDGVVAATPFLDLSGAGVLSTAGEQGLLGLAFAPDYGTSGRVYVSFTDVNGSSVVARFLRSTGNPSTLDATTRFDFLWSTGQRAIPHPALCGGAVCGNHNGGHLAFGPDGFLYVGFGDGGSANDPLHLAQNPQSYLGKMVRLDVSVPLSDTEGYDVPPSNPFLGLSVLPEIWAFGLRNPWRWSFDYPRAGSTGAMVIGDVGQWTTSRWVSPPSTMAGAIAKGRLPTSPVRRRTTHRCAIRCSTTIATRGDRLPADSCTAGRPSGRAFGDDTSTRTL